MRCAGPVTPALIPPRGQPVNDPRDGAEPLAAAGPDDLAVRHRRRQHAAARALQQLLEQAVPGVEQSAVDENLARIENVDHRRQADGQILQNPAQFLLRPHLSTPPQEFATSPMGIFFPPAPKRPLPGRCRWPPFPGSRGCRSRTAAVDIDGEVAEFAAQAAVALQDAAAVHDADA